MKKIMKVCISSLVCATVLVGSLANTYAQSTENTGTDEVKIVSLNSNNFIVEDGESSKLICSIDKNSNSINIVDQDGEKSVVKVDVLYNEDGVAEQYVSTIDGEEVAKLELSEDGSNAINEIKEDESTNSTKSSLTKSSLTRSKVVRGKSKYNWEFLHRYTMTANATKKATQIAVAIVSVAGIYAGFGNAVAVAQIVIQQYKEHKTIKYPPLSLNVLYAKNAPQSIQIKKVFRIYKDSKASKLSTMVTFYSPIS